MSFAARLIHDLTHVRTPRNEGDLDDYGQPEGGTPVETAVRGLVQPRSVREIVDSRNAGAEIGDHVIFLSLMDVHSGDYFEWNDDRYQVKGVRRFEFGRSPHLEVDTVKIEAALVGAS